MATVITVPGRNLKSAKVSEINLNNPTERQLFNNVFGFHEDSLKDLPLVDGVRHFCIDANGTTMDVFVGENLLHTLIAVYGTQTAILVA